MGGDGGGSLAGTTASSARVAGGRVRGRVGRHKQTVDHAFLGFTYESYADTHGRGGGGAGRGKRRQTSAFSKTQFLQAKYVSPLVSASVSVCVGAECGWRCVCFTAVRAANT